MDWTIREFCAHQKEWLEAELQSEEDEVPMAASKKSGGTGGKTKNSATAKNEIDFQHKSDVLAHLGVEAITVGLYGRTVVTLTARTVQASTTNQQQRQEKNSVPLLPAHRFTTGDEVEIRSKTSSAKQNQPGVISQVTETSISVALFGKHQHNSSNSAATPVNPHNTNEEETGDILSHDGDGGGQLLLVPSRSIEVHKKYLSALHSLEKHGVDHPVAGSVVRALFDTATLDEEAPAICGAKPTAFEPFNDRLDDSQIEAIQFALADTRPICCIHGPPGTGKTTTLVELIRQAAHVRNKKILVAAPSNVAVDNLLSRLVIIESSGTAGKKATRRNLNNHSNRSSKKLRMVRLGHPARLQPEILSYSLEALVKSSDGTEIVRQVRSELQSFLKVLSNPSSRGNDKRVAYREMKSLRSEIKRREEKVVRELLSSAQVVLATCVGAANSILSKLSEDDDGLFDLVVIDEAAQALEAACWIPALRGKRLILAGDHKQLPPTIRSNKQIVMKGLGRTMFERVMDLYGKDDSRDQVSRMLQVQYRMNHSISDWASEALYGGQLRSHESVSTRTLSQLIAGSTGKKEAEAKDADDDLAVFEPLLLIDTAGCGMYESVNPAGSRFNEMEAEIVGQHVRHLVAYGVPPEQIAVISPYNGQVELLRCNLLSDLPRLEIRSVDGFQGGEREAVVISLVRSSAKGGMDGIGFLRDDRRLNVAVTRAKRHCCVIADSETVSQSVFVKSLVDWIEQHGESRTALEFIENSCTNDGQIDSDLLAAAEELDGILDGVAPSQKSTTKPPPSVDEHDLQQRVEEFAKNSRPGEELVFSPELSRGDRRIIHEAAERLGLEHRSEGVEHVNRQLTLKIPQNNVPVSVEYTSTQNDVGPKSKEIVALETETAGAGHVAQPFAALSVGEEETEDGSTSAEEAEFSLDSAVVGEQTERKPGFSMNSTLTDLAKERVERQRLNRHVPRTDVAPKKKQQGKQKGNRLGGKTKQAPTSGKVEHAAEDEMDDMAFLDAQIEKVQTSHGRQLDGTGQYRTIMNGILVAKPEKKEKKKDDAASSALKAKLKEAQDGRKFQKKKK